MRRFLTDIYCILLYFYGHYIDYILVLSWNILDALYEDKKSKLFIRAQYTRSKIWNLDYLKTEGHKHCEGRGPLVQG